MKKNIKYYLICWIVLVALFNVVCFVTPAEMNGISKYVGAFWVGYGFITATFVLHLIYAFFALSTNSKEKRVLNVPLMIISCCEVVFMVVAGMICMVIPGLPNWLGVLICSIILAFSFISVVVVKGVGENVLNANKILNETTSKFRELYDTSLLLISNAKTEEIKTIARTVSETIRYSDPVSDESIRFLEVEIESKLNDLNSLISKEENLELIRSKADELLRLLETRNNKCKTMKRQRV